EGPPKNDKKEDIDPGSLNELEIAKKLLKEADPDSKQAEKLRDRIAYYEGGQEDQSRESLKETETYPMGGSGTVEDSFHKEQEENFYQEQYFYQPGPEFYQTVFDTENVKNDERREKYFQEQKEKEEKIANYREKLDNLLLNYNFEEYEKAWNENQDLNSAEQTDVRTEMIDNVYRLVDNGQMGIKEGMNTMRKVRQYILGSQKKWEQEDRAKTKKDYKETSFERNYRTVNKGDYETEREDPNKEFRLINAHISTAINNLEEQGLNLDDIKTEREKANNIRNPQNSMTALVDIMKRLNRMEYGDKKEEGKEASVFEKEKFLRQIEGHIFVIMNNLEEEGIDLTALKNKLEEVKNTAETKEREKELLRFLDKVKLLENRKFELGDGVLISTNNSEKVEARITGVRVKNDAVLYSVEWEEGGELYKKTVSENKIEEPENLEDIAAKEKEEKYHEAVDYLNDFENRLADTVKENGEEKLVKLAEEKIDVRYAKSKFIVDQYEKKQREAEKLKGAVDNSTGVNDLVKKIEATDIHLKNEQAGIDSPEHLMKRIELADRLKNPALVPDISGLRDKMQNLILEKYGHINNEIDRSEYKKYLSKKLDSLVLDKNDIEKVADKLPPEVFASIDDKIENTTAVLNSIDGVQTNFSCAGHLSGSGNNKFDASINISFESEDKNLPNFLKDKIENSYFRDLAQISTKNGHVSLHFILYPPKSWIKENDKPTISEINRTSERALRKNFGIEIDQEMSGWDFRKKLQAEQRKYIRRNPQAVFMEMPANSLTLKPIADVLPEKIEKREYSEFYDSTEAKEIREGFLSFLEEVVSSYKSSIKNS
ncbi:MAG: hypothetical protein R6V40_02165, partial [Candidatus Moraniibacteriota bacterium]